MFQPSYALFKLALSGVIDGYLYNDFKSASSRSFRRCIWPTDYMWCLARIKGFYMRYQFSTPYTWSLFWFLQQYQATKVWNFVVTPTLPKLIASKGYLYPMSLWRLIIVGPNLLFFPPCNWILSVCNLDPASPTGDTVYLVYPGLRYVCLLHGGLLYLKSFAIFSFVASFAHFVARWRVCIFSTCLPQILFGWSVFRKRG